MFGIDAMGQGRSSSAVRPDATAPSPLVHIHPDDIIPTSPLLTPSSSIQPPVQLLIVIPCLAPTSTLVGLAIPFRSTVSVRLLYQLAKMLRYLGLSNLCDLTFVVFLVGWLLTRQVGLFLVIRSIIFDLPQYIPYRWDPSEGFLWTRKIHYTFIGAMSVLLCLATMWFYLACMVAIRVVRGMGAEDSRSDDEDEESPLEDVPEVQSSAGHITKSGDVTPAGASTPSENGNGTGNGDLRKRR